MRRASHNLDGSARVGGISIHALHEESEKHVFLRNLRLTFQSTLSMRRATGKRRIISARNQISIHALHEESEVQPRLCSRVPSPPSHALHEESDIRKTPLGDKRDHQATLSMRRATESTAALVEEINHQATLSMRRASDVIPELVGPVLPPSHALHEESDMDETMVPARRDHQATLSMRRASSHVRGDLFAGSHQATLSMRRASFGRDFALGEHVHQATLSMRRARPACVRSVPTTSTKPRSP